MNFNQWKNYAAKNDVAKVTYCCGDQYALVETVVDDIKNILQVPATDLISIDASQDIPVWEIASQYPLDPSNNRLTIVRYAEKITDWDNLEPWLAQSRANPKNFVVFVSYESDAPSIFSRGKRVSYQDHIEVIRTKGKFIKCSMPNDDDLRSWAESYGLSKASADYLIDRVSGDTSAMLEVLIKIKVWKGSPSPKALSLLCEELALDSFADYLIMGNKAAAYLSLKSMTESDKSKIISRLDSRLDYVMEIGRCVRKRMYDPDIASSAGIKIFLVKRFKSVSKDYDLKKVKHCRQILAMIDGAIQDGAKVGTWETLITLW